MIQLRKVFLRFVTALCAVAVGGLAAEGFLRLLYPEEIFYETWFTPGIHAPDADYGYVFKSDYDGWMLHPDRVRRGVPLTLDDHGFRQRVVTGAGAEDAARLRILCLGGRSMMMSYGLADGDTLQDAIAEGVGGPVEVVNSAWAGWNLYLNFQMVADRMEKAGSESLGSFDLAIVGIYNESPTTYAGQDFRKLPPAPGSDWLFRYRDGIVLWADGWVAQVGRPAFQSHALFGLLRAGDRIRALGNDFLSSEPPAPKARNEFDQGDPGDLLRFLVFLDNWFAERDTETLFVFLPRRYVGPDHYAPLRDRMPDRLNWMDLQSEAYPIADEAFIAMHHYDRELAESLGARIGKKAQQVIEATQRKGRAP